MDAGKAAVIAAIITAIATLGASMIGVYQPLRKENQTLQQQNTELQEQNDALVEESQSGSSSTEDTIVLLQERISELEADNSELRARNATLVQQNSELQSALEQALAQLKKNPDNPEPMTDWISPYMIERYSTIYDGTDTSKYFNVAGIRQTKGICFNGDWGYAPYAIWNTKGQYSTMEFTICSRGSGDSQMEIDLSGEYYDTYTLKWDDPPKSFTIPLNNATNVKISFDKGVFYGMYDISFT